MRDVYSIYDAKANLSQLLKMVKEGREIIISERGTPIVKMVPFLKEQSFKERLAHLKRIGVLLPARKNKWPQGVKRPGALKRFLNLRDLKILAAKASKGIASDLIRRAVRDFIKKNRERPSFPFLKKHLLKKPRPTSFGDAVAYQRSLRKEWD